jgi:N-terminal domain of galactosyltransferase
MSEPLVSVVLPLFGDHRAVRTLPAVSRAWLRQRVPCEVVVAVADGTRLPDLGEALDTGRIRVVAAGRDSISPGPLRNLAAAAARAPVLYLGDADIVPLGRDFLDRALDLLGEGPVVQPWMYRLVNPADALAGPPLEPPARGRACHLSLGPDGLLTAIGGERFSWLNPELLVVDPPDGVGWPTLDDEAWRPAPFHWGGIMLRREDFEAVGRYCTRYLGWGCEDDDLIAKLDGRFGVVRAWRTARLLTCLHFEHPRTHTFAWVRDNQAILGERLVAGIDAMIKEDLG